MSKIYESIYEEAAKKWLLNKGEGTILLAQPLNIYDFLCLILDKMISKRELLTALIVVENYKVITYIKDYLTTKSIHKDLYIDAIACKRIRIYTQDYCKTYNFRIGEHVNLISFTGELDWVKTMDITKFVGRDFMLQIINDYPNSYIQNNVLRDNAPAIFEIYRSAIEETILTSPVREEEVIEVDLSQEDRELYDRYTEYINTTIRIFGSYDTINKCMLGDKILGISADSFLNDVARSNGWTDIKDKNNIYYDEIDAIFNPFILRERIKIFNEITRKRKDLVFGNKNKIPEIIKIIDMIGDGNRVLIISETSEIAQRIATTINEYYKQDRVLEYHNKLENIPMYDNHGIPIVYKSGAKEGQIKLLGSEGQKSNNLKKFNLSKSAILSANLIKDDFNATILINCGYRSKKALILPNVTKTYILNSKDTIQSEKKKSFSSEIFVDY
jgi:hypothetical protein